MNIAVPDLKSRLLARLQMFSGHNACSSANVPCDGQMFAYCALQRERIASVVSDTPIIGIVLRGQKEVWRADTAEVLTPGTVFAFPRGVPLDIVNVPDMRSGIYESLVLPITGLPPGIAPLAPARRAQGFAVTLTPDLVEAICHAATTIADRTHGEALRQHRIAEMLTLLAADPAGRHLLAGDLSERAAWIVAHDPAHPWSVDELAQKMGVGASTLRRGLTREGKPFRRLLTDVRMHAAQNALRQGASITEAAIAAGYVSRAHFNNAYRTYYGHPPRNDRGK